MNVLSQTNGTKTQGGVDILKSDNITFKCNIVRCDKKKKKETSFSSVEQSIKGRLQ